MTDGGYILLYRRLLENPVFRDVPEAMFFAWLIMLANWKPGTKRYDERVYRLDRGDLVMGERKMAEAWGWSRKKVHGLIKRLFDENMITQKWSQHGSQRAPVISICNYDVYQISLEEGGQGGGQGGAKVEPPKNKGNEGNKESTVLKDGSPTVDNTLALKQMVKAWNDTCGDLLGRVVKMTIPRQQKLRKRFKEDFGGSVDQWRTYLHRIRASPFLTGENDRGWKADFDWILEPRNLVKIIEGKYDAGPPAKPRSKIPNFKDVSY